MTFYEVGDEMFGDKSIEFYYNFNIQYSINLKN